MLSFKPLPSLSLFLSLSLSLFFSFSVYGNTNSVHKRNWEDGSFLQQQHVVSSHAVQDSTQIRVVHQLLNEETQPDHLIPLALPFSLLWFDVS